MIIVAEITVRKLSVGMPGILKDLLHFELNGIVEDQKHFGPTRVADARQRPGFSRPEKGTLDENWRMFSAVCIEDIEKIDEKYRNTFATPTVKIEPEWLGPNIVFSGVQNFTRLPVDSIIDFPGGPALIVTGENKACPVPGRIVAEKLLISAGNEKFFVVAADGLRGVVGKVLRPGVVSVGMKAKIFSPVDNFRNFPDFYFSRRHFMFSKIFRYLRYIFWNS
jgi:hypothetical protein